MTTSLDTNILVRLIARDDASQIERAATLLRAQPVWIGTTVILETQWVLRAAYNYEPAQVIEAFERLVAMKNVAIEAPRALRRALQWHREGMDFADALHLASSDEQSSFATFDQTLRKQARRVAAHPLVVEP